MVLVWSPGPCLSLRWLSCGPHIGALVVLMLYSGDCQVLAMKMELRWCLCGAQVWSHSYHCSHSFAKQHIDDRILH